MEDEKNTLLLLENMMKDIRLKKFNILLFYFTALSSFLLPSFPVAAEPILKNMFPPEITGECILEIRGTGFGKDKGRVFLNDDKIQILKWKKKKIRVFVSEAYELPYITIVKKNGKTIVFQTEGVEKDCTYDGLKSLALESGEISYSKKWKVIKYNKKKGVAMLLRKDRNALISFASTGVIPEVFTIYSMVNYFRKNEIKAGKISLSSINSFVNCEGRSGYSFMVKSYLKKNTPYFQFYIYFMDDSRRIYQVIFSSIKKKDCRKKASLKVLKNIHFAG